MSQAPIQVLPKPCLKQLGTALCAAEKKHAHFPPPSQEARRYSGIEYDRTPIQVLTNELALPSRGCPGRTFDDVDAHHYRHQLKKHSKSGPAAKYSSGDEVHPNQLAAAMAMQMKPGHLPVLTESGSGSLLPLSTIYTDISESDGDGTTPISESDREQYLHSSVSMARGAQPKRLRKTNPADRHRVSGDGWQRTPSSPTSTFASCPGSNSCLGGF